MIRFLKGSLFPGHMPGNGVFVPNLAQTERDFYALRLENAPAAGVVVTPGTATLTVTTFAPTVSAGSSQTVVPGTAALTLTTFAPIILAPRVVVPGTATLTLTTFSPTVTSTNHQVVVPGTASLILTTFAPTVTSGNNQVVTPAPAALNLTAFPPTVSVTNSQVITPGPASLTVTGFSPTISISNHVTVTPGVATLIIASFAPTVTTSSHKIVEPGAAILNLSTFAPTVEVSIDQFPVILIGGDDAPRRRVARSRKERRDVFKDMEQTIHRLLHPDPVVAEDAPIAPVLDTGAARRAIDELVVLAQGQHALLQRARRLASEIDGLESDQRAQEEEEFLIWML